MPKNSRRTCHNSRFFGDFRADRTVISRRVTHTPLDPSRTPMHRTAQRPVEKVVSAPCNPRIGAGHGRYNGGPSATDTDNICRRPRRVRVCCTTVRLSRRAREVETRSVPVMLRAVRYNGPTIVVRRRRSRCNDCTAAIEPATRGIGGRTQHVRPGALRYNGGQSVVEVRPSRHNAYMRQIERRTSRCNGQLTLFPRHLRPIDAVLRRYNGRSERSGACLACCNSKA